MKQNIEIEVPEGYKAVYNEITKKVEIVKVNTKPKTWKEFCKNYPVKKGEGGIRPDSDLFKMEVFAPRDIDRDRNVCTSVEEARAFLAFMQLRQLRKAWVGEWEPDWEYDNDENKYCILAMNTEFIISCYCNIRFSLSFPTEEMAKEFLSCFRDLLETAKPLL